MTLKERLSWFKSQFGHQVEEATRGTPITTDLVASIALQETGYIWSALLRRYGNDVAGVLEGCVGDTLDYPRRRAFPRNREQLESHPQGEAMFEIARTALAGLAEINGTYRQVYDRSADKFCRGYGIFQFDLQHLQTDPDFFINKQWADFDICLAKCLKELRRALRVRGFKNRESLSVFEEATVAIVYNRGSYDPSRKLRQGHRDGNGRYYGEHIFDYIMLAQSVALNNDRNAEELSDDVTLNYRVNARSGLRLRGGPGTDYETIDTLEFGTEVNVLSFMGHMDAWALVDLKGDGRLDGFMYAEFLQSTGFEEHESDEIENELRRDMWFEAGRDDLLNVGHNHQGECTDC